MRARALFPIGSMVLSSFFFLTAIQCVTAGILKDIFPINPGQCIDESLSPSDGILQDTGTYTDIYTFVWGGGPLSIVLDSSEFDENLIVYAASGTPIPIDQSTSEPESFVMASAPPGNYSVYTTSKSGGGLVTGSYRICVQPGAGPTSTPTPSIANPTPTPTFSETPALPHTPTATPPPDALNAEDLLRLIEANRLAGCDLNGDGRTDAADVLLAVKEGFDLCDFDEAIDINENPGDDIAMIVGHAPEVAIVHGTKDPTGDLIDITSIEMTDDQLGNLTLILDSLGRPAMLTVGNDSIAASFVDANLFDFGGTIEGLSVGGTGDFSQITPGDIDQFIQNPGLKRSFLDAGFACQDARAILHQLICDEFACRMAQAYLLTVFLTGTDFPCSCLTSVFSREQDPRLVKIEGYRRIAQVFYERVIEIYKILGACHRSPNSYNCSERKIRRLQKLKGRYHSAIIFVGLMANQEFDSLAAETNDCKEPATRTPTPTGTPTETHTSTFTPTATETSTPTATETGTTTVTPTSTPTPTSTETPTASPSPTSTGCDPNASNPIQISISSPTGSETSERVIDLVGTVSDNSVASGRLEVNGVAQDIAVSGGAFSTKVILRSGDNTIYIEVSNSLGQKGCRVIAIRSTTPTTTISVTLTWNLPGTDVDLYIIQPDLEVAWYNHKTTTIGGRLDVDNTSGLGPENYFLSSAENDTVLAGVYSIGVHYYDDHQADTENPVRPVVWSVDILLNEGTPFETRQHFSGTLSNANSSNHIPGSSGPDWATATNLNYAPPGN